MLDELKRSVEQFGFTSLKPYNEHRCTDPGILPLIALAIKLGVPILHHAGRRGGLQIGGWTEKLGSSTTYI